MGKSLLAYGRVFSGKDNRSLVEAVTAEDIQNAFRNVLDFTRLSKLVYI